MIARTVGLSLHLLRAGGRRAVASAALAGAGIAIGTVLLSVALGLVHGWDARETRTGWRTGPLVAADPVALVRTTTDAVAGRPLQQVDLAALRPAAPAPPGLPRMPAPGEVWVSPALAALIGELPRDVLADRFSAPAGLIIDGGLRGPDELVAITGRAPTDAPRTADATPVASFTATSAGADLLEVYRQLTYVAVALILFPVASLLGASARLTALRRAERLATLRLLGASTGQVTVAAVTEVTVIAIGAAVVGVLAQWLLSPALALIELGGGSWFPADLRPSAATAVGIVVGVTLLATTAALGGMRQIVVGPLGVLRRQRAGGARLLRLLGLVAGLVVFAVASGVQRAAPANVVGLVSAVGVLALFGAVSTIGPLVMRLLGGGMVRSARTPAVLIAGRRLLDDPRGAFRPLAGLTLAVFVAGFIAPLTAAISHTAYGDDTALRLTAPQGTVAQLATAVRNRLAERGITADVAGTQLRGAPGLAVTPAAPTDRDRVRTALAPLVPGTPVTTAREADAESAALIGDLQRGAIALLAGSAVVAATATGTAAAARVLDHRRTLRLLRLAGTPFAVLDGARRAETVRPLVVLGAVALVLGLLCASPFAAATGVLHPAGLVVLGATLLGGAALVTAASAASRPLLRSVTTGLGRDD